MSTVELSYEQVLEAAKGLREEEKERLLFELSPELSRALQQMEQAYDRDRTADRTVSLDNRGTRRDLAS